MSAIQEVRADLAEMRRLPGFDTTMEFSPVDPQLREDIIKRNAEILSQEVLAPADVIDVVLGIIDLIGGVREVGEDNSSKIAGFYIFEDNREARRQVKLQWKLSRSGNWQTESSLCEIQRGDGFRERVDTDTGYLTGAWGTRSMQPLSFPWERPRFTASVKPNAIIHLPEFRDTGEVYSVVADRPIIIAPFLNEKRHPEGVGGGWAEYSRYLAFKGRKEEVQEIKDFYQRLFQHAVDASSASNQYAATGA